MVKLEDTSGDHLVQPPARAQEALSLSSQQRCSSYWSQGRQHPSLFPHLPHWSFHCRIKLAKLDFPLVNPHWLLVMIFLPFTCLEMFSRISCSITFPGIEVRLTNLSLPRYSFLPILKKETFTFLQSSSTSSCHDQRKITESALATTISSLRTHERISSEPMDLFMLSLLSILTLSSHHGCIFLAPFFPWCLRPAVP